jgi:radical SAM superfamily enzyme YgiQ (UPF0313 family)
MPQHIQLVGLSELKSPDNKVWKFSYAFPIIIAQLQKTRHTFDHVDTHLDKLTDSELLDHLLQGKSRVFGISGWSHNYLQVKDIARRLRERDKDAVIIVGGLLTGNADVLMRSTEVDIAAVSAEGEYILPEILDALDNGWEGMRNVRGIVFKDRLNNGEVVSTPPREVMNLPQFQKQEMPAFEYFAKYIQELSDNLSTREDMPVKGFPLLTMRGCPFHCSFCGHIYGHRFLRKDWSLFFDQVEYLTKRFGITGFFSQDTNMFLNTRDVDEYCRMYRERGMTFTVCAEMRLTFGDEAMFRKLRDHGVLVTLFGFESGSQEMLDRMRKGTDYQKMKGIIQAALDADCLIHGNFVFGTPGERPKTIRETRRFMLFLEKGIARQRQSFSRRGMMNTSGYGWTTLLPSPTSELYKLARAKGLIPDEEKYLESLSDQRFKKLLKGSNFKIELALRAGDVNMSEFTSKAALTHYVEYNNHLVWFLGTFYRDLSDILSRTPELLGHARNAVGFYLKYLARTLADRAVGRKGLVVREKAGAGEPPRDLNDYGAGDLCSPRTA